jgi:hypothetical protein
MYISTGEGLKLTPGLSEGKSSVCFERSPCFRNLPSDFLALSSKPLTQLLPKLKKLDQFSFGSSKLRTFHKFIIKQVARMIVKRSQSRRQKPFKTILLVGAADEVGSYEKNCTLGKMRARSVKNELVRMLEILRPGITKDINFVVLSLGECAPVIEKATREKRNRYVNLWFSEDLFPKASSPPRAPAPKDVWPTRPLPPSEYPRFEKAIINLEKEVARMEGFWKDPQKQRYLCWIKKLKNPNVDDRIIGWSKICPSISGAQGSALVIGPCDLTKGNPVNQTKLERSIRSVSDVDVANQSLKFITYMRSAIVVSFEMTSSPLKNFGKRVDNASDAIEKLYQWSNAPLGGSSAMPRAYRAIKSWIIQRQNDPKSLYSCF